MQTLSTIIVLIIGLVLGAVGHRYLLQEQPTVPMAESPDGDAGAPQPVKPVRWKMASAYSGTVAMVGTLGQKFAHNVNAVSGGTVEVEFFDPGALVPALEIFDAVASGSIDVGYATPGFWAGKEPALQLFAAVPFGPGAPEYLAWFYYGGGKEIYQELYGKQGIHGIMCGLFPPEASGWFRDEITSVEQLQGLKMRFFGLGARVMEKLGVSTQLLAGGDIFPALELGTIDATEYASPPIDKDMGFYQIAKHYYFPGWHQQSTWVDIMVNLEQWNALSDQQRLQIETVCGDLVREAIAEGEYLQVPAIEYLTEKGVQFHQWSPEILAAYEAAWLDVAGEEAEKSPEFQRAWNSLQNFREGYAAWREMGYLK